MSGICGVFLRRPGAPLEEGALEAMCRALGPAGEIRQRVLGGGSLGLGVQAPPDSGAAILETRIKGRAVTIAFHGNIYRGGDGDGGAHKGPEPGLEASVRRMTERYFDSGMSFLVDLRGEFALALHDSEGERLFLATDRFRVRPLLYGSDANAFLFASRMRGIDRSPVPIARTIDERAIMDVVASSYIPTPDTIYHEIRKLPPGHLLSYCGGDIRIEPYWDIDFRDPSPESEPALESEVREALRDAIAVRLHADGGADRVGAFLSGGIDSTTVTGVLTQIAGRPIRTFTIGFGEERFNEMSYARIAARAFASEHFEHFVSPADTAEALPIIVEEFDEPFGNASAVPTYFCARLAKEHGVSAMYAGDGGDELFAGNERYSFQRIFDYYHRVPSWLREPVLKPAIRALARAVPLGLFTRAQKYVEKASLTPVARMTAYDFLSIVSLGDLASPGLLGLLDGYDAARQMAYHYDRAPGKTDLDRQLYLDLKLAISDNDLFKVSRMTERAGVAVRYPFLDSRVADVAARVPAALKMRGRKLRVFFKNAYRDLLPPEVIAKTKHGFGLPIAIWLRTDPHLNEMMRDLVLGPRSISRGYFQRSALERLVAEHQHDETSFYGTALWNLMVLELWHRRYRDI